MFDKQGCLIYLSHYHLFCGPYCIPIYEYAGINYPLRGQVPYTYWWFIRLKIFKCCWKSGKFTFYGEFFLTETDGGKKTLFLKVLLKLDFCMIPCKRTYFQKQNSISYKISQKIMTTESRMNAAILREKIINNNKNYLT